MGTTAKITLAAATCTASLATGSNGMLARTTAYGKERQGTGKGQKEHMSNMHRQERHGNATASKCSTEWARTSSARGEGQTGSKEATAAAADTRAQDERGPDEQLLGVRMWVIWSATGRRPESSRLPTVHSGGGAGGAGAGCVCGVFTDATFMLLLGGERGE